MIVESGVEISEASDIIHVSLKIGGFGVEYFQGMSLEHLVGLAERVFKVKSTSTYKGYGVVLSGTRERWDSSHNHIVSDLEAYIIERLKNVALGVKAPPCNKYGDLTSVYEFVKRINHGIIKKKLNRRAHSFRVTITHSKAVELDVQNEVKAMSLNYSHKSTSDIIMPVHIFSENFDNIKDKWISFHTAYDNFISSLEAKGFSYAVDNYRSMDSATILEMDIFYYDVKHLASSMINSTVDEIHFLGIIMEKKIDAYKDKL